MPTRILNVHATTLHAGRHELLGSKPGRSRRRRLHDHALANFLVDTRALIPVCRARTWYRPGRSERVARFAHPRPTEDGEQLKYRKNEARCVLITSGLGPRLHMFAHLRPCDAKEASGLLTVAAAAVRKHIEHAVMLEPSRTLLPKITVRTGDVLVSVADAMDRRSRKLNRLVNFGPQPLSPIGFFGGYCSHFKPEHRDTACASKPLLSQIVFINFPICHTGTAAAAGRHERPPPRPAARAAAAALDQARRVRGVPAQGAAAARDRHLQWRPGGAAAPVGVPVGGPNARLVPGHRRRGHGLALLRAHLLELVPRREPRGRQRAQNSNSYCTHRSYSPIFPFPSHRTTASRVARPRGVHSRRA